MTDLWFNGMPVFLSDRCLEKTDERHFPESRHRSKRIRKKLLKRFGSEFVMKPACYEHAGKLHMHPTFWAATQQAIRQRQGTGILLKGGGNTFKNCYFEGQETQLRVTI